MFVGLIIMATPERQLMLHSKGEPYINRANTTIRVKEKAVRGGVERGGIESKRRTES